MTCLQIASNRHCYFYNFIQLKTSTNKSKNEQPKDLQQLVQSPKPYMSSYVMYLAKA